MRRRRHIQRGLSLIETTISMLLVGLVLLGALAMTGAIARMQRVQAEAGTGRELARELMAEILATRYIEPTDAAVFGREAESDVDRSDWDDLDDYDGLVEQPPRQKDGKPLPNVAGWERRAIVRHVDPMTMVTLPETTNDTGLRSVTVTATAPDGRVVTLTSLRSSTGAFEQPPPVDTTVLSGVDFSITTSDGDVIDGATSLLNQVEGTP